MLLDFTSKTRSLFEQNNENTLRSFWFVKYPDMERVDKQIMKKTISQDLESLLNMHQKSRFCCTFNPLSVQTLQI